MTIEQLCSVPCVEFYNWQHYMIIIEADAMVECVSRDVDFCVGLRRNST